jgi:hypothetical protein
MGELCSQPTLFSQMGETRLRLGLDAETVVV